MISRRPNMRASRENAPGPSPMIVTSMVNPNMSEIFESKRVGAQPGSSESPTAAAVTATSAPMIGVAKPAKSRAPAANAERPMNQVAVVGLGSPM
jgi:hypothetical protein